MATALNPPSKLLHLAKRSQRLLQFQYRTKFKFWQKSEEKEKVKEFEQPAFINDRYQTLTKRTSIETTKGYKPPKDVEERIQMIVMDSLGYKQDWRNMRLDNRRHKYKLLTKLIKEFDHDVTNMDLNHIQTVSDAVEYFQTEVRDTCTYEDLAKIDLPKNLHINQEYIRFNPATDTLFKGKSAFPGRKTVIPSIKYGRKYKAH